MGRKTRTKDGELKAAGEPVWACYIDTVLPALVGTNTSMASALTYGGRLDLHPTRLCYSNPEAAEEAKEKNNGK